MNNEEHIDAPEAPAPIEAVAPPAPAIVETPYCAMCRKEVKGDLLGVRGASGETVCHECIEQSYLVVLDVRARRKLKKEVLEENQRLRERVKELLGLRDRVRDIVSTEPSGPD